MEKNKVTRVKFAPLTLRANYSDGEDYGLLTWATRNGYPRITVFTENKHKSENFDYNKMITAPFDYVTLNMFLSIFEKVIDADPDTKYQVECKGSKFVNRERTDEVIVQATVTVGKDKDGVIYMAATEDGKRKVKFDLILGKWHTIMINGDHVTDKAMLSKIYATGYLKAAKKLLGQQLINDTLKVDTASTTSSSGGEDLTGLL